MTEQTTEQTTEPKQTEQHHIINQTEQALVMVAGFPTRKNLAKWLGQEGLIIYCLFPSKYKSDQVQLGLRNSIMSELTSLTETQASSGTSPNNSTNTSTNTNLPSLAVAMKRCMALILVDDTMGDSMETFDFARACEQTLQQLTPKSPAMATSVELPQFGDS